MNQQSALVGNNTERWQDLDGAHHLHPFTNPRELKLNAVRIIESAQGIYLTDSDGNQYLDAMAGLWTAHRIADGTAETLPESPPIDDTGLAMEIVF